MTLQNSSAKIKRIRRISVALFAVFVIILPSVGLIVPRVVARFFFFSAFFGAVETGGLYLCVFAVFSSPFFFGYMMFCFGKTKTQSLYLYDGELVYEYYNGTDVSIRARITREYYTTYISPGVPYRVTNRYIYIYGVFRQDVTGRIPYEKKVRRVKLIRILEDEDESKMLRFLDGAIADKGTINLQNSRFL